MEDQATNKSVTAEATGEADDRKRPWRSLPEFKSVQDKVYVNKVRDMRLFGNHVNAHS